MVCVWCLVSGISPGWCAQRMDVKCCANTSFVLFAVSEGYHSRVYTSRASLPATA
jgi:hypothetical protein